MKATHSYTPEKSLQEIGGEDLQAQQHRTMQSAKRSVKISNSGQGWCMIQIELIVQNSPDKQFPSDNQNIPYY